MLKVWLACATLAFAQSPAENLAQYQELFFAQTELPPKIESWPCAMPLGELMQGADAHQKFLLEQLTNTQKTGQISYRYETRFSDVAYWILSARYGALDDYADFDRAERLRANDDASLERYVMALQKNWQNLLESDAELERNDCIETPKVE